MDKKTQQILLLAGVGIIAYMLWKKREETSEFVGGARKLSVGGCVSPKCKCYYKDGRPFTAGGQQMCAEHCCSGGI
tara:strand:- start:514 stop:741 length:228 start_codon:yes stop_codon:yes gene_type:complete